MASAILAEAHGALDVDANLREKHGLRNKLSLRSAPAPRPQLTQALRHQQQPDESEKKEDTNTPAPVVAEDDVCVVCIEKKKNMVFIPCGHLCCCAVCGNKVGSQCPVCRQPILHRNAVYK